MIILVEVPYKMSQFLSQLFYMANGNSLSITFTWTNNFFSINYSLLENCDKSYDFKFFFFFFFLGGVTDED